MLKPDNDFLGARQMAVPPWDKPDGKGRNWFMGAPVLFRCKLEVLSAADGFTKYALPVEFCGTNFFIINPAKSRHTVAVTGATHDWKETLPPNALTMVKPGIETLHFTHAGPTGESVEIALIGNDSSLLKPN